MIQANASCSITLECNEINPADHSITLYEGANWIGYFGTQPLPVSAALANLSATVGDFIMAQDGSSTTYSTYGWSSFTFEPGKAYIYTSKNTVSKTFTFPASK